METKIIELALYHDTQCDIISAHDIKDEAYILCQPGFVRISEPQNITFNLISNISITKQQVGFIDTKLKDLGAQINALKDEKESLLDEND